MDFDLTDEQEQLRTAVLDFARRELDDEPADRATPFERAAWHKCAEAGLLGLPVPTEHGGQGADALTTVIAFEALGYGCRDNGLIFSLNAHLWSAVMPILRFGSDEQKERWLPGLCDGSLIGVQAMSEPESGSDAFALTTRATEADGGYLLSGAKTFITNAPVADVFVVFATTNPDRGWAGLCAFLVEPGTEGLAVGPPLQKMGLQSSPMAELFFDDCAVSAEALVGRAGAGMMVFNHSMEWERSCILASAVGSMRRQLEQSLEYARTREQFGQPIGKFQSVANRLVDMKVRLEAGRLLLYQMAWLRSQGRKAELEASMVKLFLAESWVQSSLDQLQVHGGSGYLSETGVEQDVRDALGARIYSGTSDIQRNLIARGLGL